MWLCRVPSDRIVDELAERYEVDERTIRADLVRVRRDVMADFPVADVTEVRTALAELALAHYASCMRRSQQALEDADAARWADAAGKDLDRLARWFGVNQDELSVTHRLAAMSSAELDRAQAEALRDWFASLPQAERQRLLAMPDRAPDDRSPERRVIDAVASAEVVSR